MASAAVCGMMRVLLWSSAVKVLRTMIGIWNLAPSSTQRGCSTLLPSEAISKAVS